MEKKKMATKDKKNKEEGGKGENFF